MGDYNFEGFQIPATGVTGEMTGGVAAQGREFGGRMSSFGALVGGLRMEQGGVTVSGGAYEAGDYTRTGLGYKSAGELQNPVISESYMDASFNANPFVWGGTVKYVRNDELRIMGLGARVGDSSYDAPKADVSDTNLSVDDGTNAPKQFPAEGWHTFGGRTAGPFGYTTPGYQVR